MQYHYSDHFPVVSSLTLPRVTNIANTTSRSYVNWKKASDQALLSYSTLCDRKCAVSLRKYKTKEIKGADLYKELVNNMTAAAETCIPKATPGKKANQHNIPMWRERMGSFKSDVDYWLQIQFLNGGPRRCPSFIREQLRVSKSRYRNQLRKLRREIEVNVAENITVQNCHRRLFKTSKVASPAVIEGHSRDTQAEMWRDHFHHVFSAKEQPPTPVMIC